MLKIKHRVNFLKRLLATAFAFSIFGVGGLVIRFIIYPLLFITPMSDGKRMQKGQHLIHYSFRFFIWLMKILGIYSYEVSGLSRLNTQGKLFVINHPTLIDVVFLLSLVKETNCIVKASLINNPFMKGPLKTANYIINDNPESLITKCVNSIKSGRSLLIFPEGTRSVPSNPLRFKKGAANIALRSAHDITPISIECLPGMLQKNIKWYKIPQDKPHFRIIIHEDICIKPYLDLDTSINIKARKLTKDLTTFFKQELNIE